MSNYNEVAESLIRKSIEYQKRKMSNFNCDNTDYSNSLIKNQEESDDTEEVHPKQEDNEKPIVENYNNITSTLYSKSQSLFGNYKTVLLTIGAGIVLFIIVYILIKYIIPEKEVDVNEVEADYEYMMGGEDNQDSTLDTVELKEVINNIIIK